MTEMFETLLDRGCEEIPLTLSRKQKEQFFEYYELLVQWNQVMNLTAITEISDVITKHFVDSLLLIRVISGDEISSYRCIDVGTGAGFPGIPLKIAFPEIQITLLDSLNKRVGFLNEVIQRLELTEIFTVHGRAEDFGRNMKYREQYDLCVSRAVANLSTLSEYCIPFVKKDGFFISYKSGKAEDEILKARFAVKRLGGEMESAVSMFLPGTNVERIFIPIKKVGITPEKYPRKAGMPSKEPLK